MNLGRSQEEEQKGRGWSRRERGATGQGRRRRAQPAGLRGRVALPAGPGSPRHLPPQASAPVSGGPRRGGSVRPRQSPQGSVCERHGHPPGEQVLQERGREQRGTGSSVQRVSTCQGVSAGMLSQRPPLALGRECKRLLRDRGSDTGKERKSIQMALTNRMPLGTVRWDRTCRQSSLPGTLPTTSRVPLLKATPGGRHPLAVPTCLARLSRVTG